MDSNSLSTRFLDRGGKKKKNLITNSRWIKNIRHSRGEDRWTDVKKGKEECREGGVLRYVSRKDDLMKLSDMAQKKYMEVNRNESRYERSRVEINKIYF